MTTSVSSSNSQMRKTRLETLDILRFFAASAVLFYHYYFIGPLQGYWPKTLFIDAAHWGDLGVDLFFVISGFVITLTSEGRSAQAFLAARATRLFPAFVACSAITATMAIMLPGISANNIIPRWIATLTYFPQFFGVEPLSSVYWTLAIEIQFYALVALLIASGIWKSRNDQILWLWLTIAFINQYIQPNIGIERLFIPEYAGHFCAGIILYRIHTGNPPRFTTAALIVSFALISKHVQHIDEWLGGSYLQFFPSLGISLAGPVIAALVFIAAKTPQIGQNARWAAVLGGLSYPFYLIHADLGFWAHAIFERKLFALFPSLVKNVSYSLMATLAIVASVLIAWLVATRVEPGLQARMKKLMEGTPKNADARQQNTHCQ